MHKVLDLWCWKWNNKYGIYNQPYATIGVDIEKENIDHCSKKYPNHRFLLIDGSVLPFDDNTFDIIHSLDVLEHVDDLYSVVSEVVRVLKPSWKFLIEVPYWKSEELLLEIKPQYWDQVHHVRMFKDWEMEEIMKKFWLTLHERKRIKHFDNIGLQFYFKHGNIINQRWDMNIPSHLRWTFRILYLPYYILYRVFQSYFDNKFPKSIYFEFTKN